MKLQARWTRWSGWRKYSDRQTGADYRSRRKSLTCGQHVIAVLTETSNPRVPAFYMFDTRGLVSNGATACDAIERFTKTYLEIAP